MAAHRNRSGGIDLGAVVDGGQDLGVGEAENDGQGRILTLALIRRPGRRRIEAGVVGLRQARGHGDIRCRLEDGGAGDVGVNLVNVH